ncbi:hypothetical protein CALVIDRAFT_567084 [Calocera viscosa TUFC12733]|uniref:BHLH domain-containing protein n=1 Tax=Calocera viscosa (strain TUFC12733) TaxID=1330018 RepID=A0A167IMJ1_CALVF|nr:hypothetical protein CALVIDRAFT_567084 [Calocera viscosa TUFC12733]
MNTLEPSYNFGDFPLPSSSHAPPPGSSQHQHQQHPSSASPISPSTAPPQPQPQSADQLLSTTEQDHFMSFLADNFGGPAFPPDPTGGLHYPPPMPASEFGGGGMHYPSWAGSAQGYSAPPPSAQPALSGNHGAGQLPPISSLTSLASTASNPSLSRPLLSNTQKRENHILSEQKRRNQIRQSYALLSLLLEGPEAGPGSNQALKGTSGMTREMIFGGQVKGKKGRARGGGKKQGKAGTLFRAVEYAKWLREGNDQLARDVADIRDRVERWQGYSQKGYVY